MSISGFSNDIEYFAEIISVIRFCVSSILFFSSKFMSDESDMNSVVCGFLNLKFY